MGKNNVKETIARMRTLAFTEVPNLIAGNSEMSIEDYLNDCRLSLNTMVVGALTGGEFVENKKEGGESWKVKFNQPLPNKSELAEIIEIVDQYIKQVETPFLVRSNTATEDDDMAIPQPGSAGYNSVPHIEKINRKKLENYIFGRDGKQSICKMLLGPVDCVQISVLGEELRKRDNINKMLIVGGIALVITGAAVAGVMMYNRHKSTAAIDDIISDVDDTSVISDMTDDNPQVISTVE